MPTWGKINTELANLIQQRRTTVPISDSDAALISPHDIIRKKYVAELAGYTGIPLIVYASGWLMGRPAPDSSVAVSTQDVMGFMEAVHSLPPGPLDLIIHSPGGDPDSAQAIMSYLRSYGFNPIRAIVPVSAKSAATMMALSCDQVVMGKHSQLGPIDPQFTVSTPEGPRMAAAQAILDQFDMAKMECAAEQQNLAAWLPILRSYLPGLLSQCINAQQAAVKIVETALHAYMLKDLSEPERSSKAHAIAAWFGNHKTHLSHGRPLTIEEVEAQGVNVLRLESDQQLQEKVLSAWHGIQLTVSQLPVAKIIENSLGSAWILQVPQQLQVLVGPPATDGAHAPTPYRNLPNVSEPGSSPGNRASRRATGRRGR